MKSGIPPWEVRILDPTPLASLWPMQWPKDNPMDITQSWVRLWGLPVWKCLLEERTWHLLPGHFYKREIVKPQTGAVDYLSLTWREMSQRKSNPDPTALRLQNNGNNLMENTRIGWLSVLWYGERWVNAGHTLTQLPQDCKTMGIILWKILEAASWDKGLWQCQQSEDICLFILWGTTEYAHPERVGNRLPVMLTLAMQGFRSEFRKLVH